MATVATIRYGLPGADCRLCDRTLDPADQQLLQSYQHEDDTPLPATTMGFCSDCRGTVAELVDDWETVPEPPVDAASIAAGYRRVADQCSFCEERLEDTPLGIEYYRAGAAHDGGLADHRHYALCDHCVDVFAEFLELSAE